MDLVPAERRGEPVLRLIRLRERERAAAGADDESRAVHRSPHLRGPARLPRAACPHTVRRPRDPTSQGRSATCRHIVDIANRMRVLGLETTCDETAAAVVGLSDDGRGDILSNEILSQIAEHAAYGGVVPEIARAHVEALDHLIERALAKANVQLNELDGIAAAAGPGLIGGVIVGLTTAKALALVARKPLMAVNHLEGHALTARLTDGIGFPYLLLLVSGGHTQLMAVKGVGD